MNNSILETFSTSSSSYFHFRNKIRKVINTENEVIIIFEEDKKYHDTKETNTDSNIINEYTNNQTVKQYLDEDTNTDSNSMEIETMTPSNDSHETCGQLSETLDMLPEPDTMMNLETPRDTNIDQHGQLSETVDTFPQPDTMMNLEIPRDTNIDQLGQLSETSDTNDEMQIETTDTIEEEIKSELDKNDLPPEENLNYINKKEHCCII